MDYFSPFMRIAFWVLFILFSPSITAQPKSAFPKMSEAEMRQLEAEMAAFQKEIDALNPAEQEAFFKSMEEAVQKIDNLSKTDEGKALLEKLDRGELSDEELDKLINQIVEEPLKPEPAPAPAPAPKPEAVEKPAPKPVITSQQQMAIDMVNSLIDHTNSFIVKAAITHDLPGRVKSWRKKGFISWMPNLTWNKLKADVEKFAQQLTLLLEKDHKTKGYIHIDNLIANESVYNNLKKVHQVVLEHEPRIEELLPLSGAMSLASKKAFQKIINQYIEALYTLALPNAIKQILSAFEPTAKTLREQEEATRKKAEAAQRRLTPGAPIVTGRAEEYNYGPAPVEEYNQPYSAPSTYQPTYEPYRPEFISSPSLEAQSVSGGGKGGSLRAGNARPEGAAEEGAEGKDKEGKKEKGLRESLQEKAGEMDKKLFADADKLLKKVTTDLEDAVDTIKKSPILSDIQGHLTSDADVDIEFATEILPELLRDLSLRKGALGSIQQMEGKLPAGSLSSYKEKLQDLYGKYSKELESVLDQLTKLEADWSAVSQKISAAKKYAYFGTQEEKPAEPQQSEQDVNAILDRAVKGSSSIDEGLQKAVEATAPVTPAADPKLEDAQRKIPTPYSLNELRKNLTELKSAIEKFGGARKKGKGTARRRS